MLVRFYGSHMFHIYNQGMEVNKESGWVYVLGVNI